MPERGKVYEEWWFGPGIKLAREAAGKVEARGYGEGLSRGADVVPDSFREVAMSLCAEAWHAGRLEAVKVMRGDSPDRTDDLGADDGFRIWWYNGGREQVGRAMTEYWTDGEPEAAAQMAWEASRKAALNCEGRDALYAFAVDCLFGDPGPAAWGALADWLVEQERVKPVAVKGLEELPQPGEVWAAYTGYSDDFPAYVKISSVGLERNEKGRPEFRIKGREVNADGLRWVGGPVRQPAGLKAWGVNRFFATYKRHKNAAR